MRAPSIDLSSVDFWMRWALLTKDTPTRVFIDLFLDLPGVFYSGCSPKKAVGMDGLFVTRTGLLASGYVTQLVLRPVLRLLV